MALRLNSIVLLLAAASAAPALAGEIALIGVIGNKAAVISIDGGEPKTVKVGQTRAGIRVISVDRRSAVIEADGRRRTLALGQHHRSGPTSPDRQSVTLSADTRGHFVADGTINGGAMRLVVDTGATMVTLPAEDASRLGIDYRKGRRALTKTASGMTSAYVVRLNHIKVGNIELAGVDAVVIEQGLDIGLLGMSFLNRVEMTREGETMTLRKRF